MRRCLLILLVLFMPLQSAWAVASVYCTHHEQGAAAAHFGHHSDGHEAPDGVSDARSAAAIIAADVHGHGHHHGETPAMVSAVPPLGAMVPVASRFDPMPGAQSHPPPGRIERPKWARLA